MLVSLQLDNFALVDKLAVEFSPQLNVLTGETGAGKSILIDAIRFVLGDRSDSILLRSQEKPCCVEAVFDIHKTSLKEDSLFASFFDDGDNALIIRREYHPQGRSKIWINSRTATLSVLKRLGRFLIDIHGQYDHQLLLDPTSHLELVDRYAKLDKLESSYRDLYQQYDALINQREEFKSLEAGREREMDLLKYQIQEIESAQIGSLDEDELKTERIRLANAEKLYEMATRALELLDGDQVSASDLMAKSAREIQALQKLDTSLEDFQKQFEDTQLHLEEGIRTLKDYQESLSFDSDRLTEVDQILEQVELLKRKYGKSLAEVQTFLAEAKAKYDKLVNSSVYEGEIDKNLKKILPELSEVSDQISVQRKKAGRMLKKVIEQELQDLQIPHAQFECQFEKVEFNLNGCDRLEFLMTLNPGQPPLPLSKIISGGEASRVMLALKKALMKVDPVLALIFDEIDANIGGRLGTVTGTKLKEIAQERQVLLITHLPQIASFADRHIKVQKVVRGGQTYAEYLLLEGKDRVKELSEMMSGRDPTEISQKHAQEMLARVSPK